MDKKEETKQPDNIIYDKNDSSVASFISYLMAGFGCRGIKQFLGIYLVILSRDYASSVLCLENLELCCDDKKSYEVVPVFYGVSRSDVRQQSGPFSDAFTKLERSNPADHVTKWRRMFAKIAELKGHEYDEELSEESEFVEEIVEDVYELLNPTEEIRIHSRQLDIQNLLCKQQWGLRTLGILGKPGIGKTTLARAVFRRMVGGYDASHFVKDFHTRYSEMTLEPLPAHFLCMTQVEEFDLNNSGSEQCHRQKRVLIVLDDVRNEQDAMSFLGEIDQFGPGSLIIITSRDRQVLEKCHLNEIYELNGLNGEDARKLFTRCAFGKDVIVKNLPMIVIKGFEGNPSALRSYANKFKGKTTEDSMRILFKDAVFNTKKNTSMCIYSNIAIHEHKSIFLNKTVLHAIQNIIFDLEEHPDLDLPNHVAESISDLRSPCVHHPSVQVQSLPKHFHRRQLVLLHGLACQFYKLWEGYKRFSRLRKINLGHCEKLVQVVELSNACYLEEINLQDCKNLDTFPDTDQLENLQFLDLSNCSGIKYFQENASKLEKLWDGAQSTGFLIPERNPRSTNLERLDLSVCSSLMLLPPSIGHLQQLKDLNMEEISRNISYLYLDKTAIEEVPQWIEDISGLSDLSMSDSWQNHPEEISTSLMRVDMSGNSFERLPDTWTSIQPKDLILGNCKNLVSLPELPATLSLLTANNCVSLESLYVHGNVLTVSLPRISLSKQILRYKACIVVESRPGPVNDPPAELSYGDVQFEFLCLDHRKEIIKIKECGIQLMEVYSRKRSGTEDGNKPAENDEELRRIRKQMRVRMTKHW
ncbi:Disease resistance protein (TIR-NBS-LRR class) [Arabidopsis thaliana]|uniref:Disease resistance protein (TIR-NBS-LRR class) n=2 Tax=Arabidopsis thaliana TaxID=3702 RepID=F4KD49_ARATH|nr:Disease resistance protein (TIR-NBS-LRR class) [Arabidopsis thaliana]AED95220.1 Disease resistance protein (TIR-NBS-LRR class) [Arabidopsis thaliana]|eukprot:NP_199337.2 Disease resistance protein (TIR-NBS-LRR class) [Arabidopsis thaliana]